MKKILLIFISSITLMSYSQNYFITDIISEDRDNACRYTYQLPDSSYVSIGFFLNNNQYASGLLAATTNKGKLKKIVEYTVQDSCWNNIGFFINENTYTLVSIVSDSLEGETDSNYIYISELDTAFSIISTKKYLFPILNQKLSYNFVKKYNSNYFISGYLNNNVFYILKIGTDTVLLKTFYNYYYAYLNITSFGNIAITGIPQDSLTCYGGQLRFLDTNTLNITNYFCPDTNVEFAFKPRNYFYQLDSNKFLLADLTIADNKWIFKLLDSNFNIIKTRIFDTQYGQGSENIGLDFIYNKYIYGVTYNYFTGKIFLICIDSALNFYYEKTIDLENNWILSGVTATIDSGCIITTTFSTNEHMATRLIKIDKNGNYQDTTSVHKEVRPNTDIITYPNPADNYIEITASQTQPANFVLFDINGRKILQKAITEKNTNISTSSLPEGIYFYKILTNNNAPVTGKIIIKH